MIKVAPVLVSELVSLEIRAQQENNNVGFKICPELIQLGGDFNCEHTKR